MKIPSEIVLFVRRIGNEIEEYEVRHTYSADGDIYCTSECYDQVSDDMTRAFAPGGHLSTAEECEKYIMSGLPQQYTWTLWALGLLFVGPIFMLLAGR